MNKTSVSRILLSIGFLIAMSLLVFSFSRMVAYFNIGTASKSQFYVTSDYFAKNEASLVWAKDDPNIVGPINKYIRKDLSEAYLAAWHSRNLSIRDQNSNSLPNHFSEDMAQRIVSHFQSSKEFNIEEKDMNHKLRLHTISLDKQVVSFSDENVKVIQNIMNEARDSVVSSTYTVLNYNVVMALDDGRWRIHSLVSRL